MKVKRRPIAYDHEVVVYVPCFQRDFNEDGDLEAYPTFTYSMADAQDDEQMAWSLEPDYVLELKGQLKYTTKDIDLGEDDESKN